MPDCRLPAADFSSSNRAASPMMSAASQCASIVATSGSRGSSAGSMPKWRSHSTCTSATDVRELVSMAIERTSRIGFVVYSATESTAPCETIATSGTMRYGPPRRYSMDGIRPTSMDPACSRRAHSDGTSYRRSNRGCMSSSCTSGRAFRKPTAPSRTRRERVTAGARDGPPRRPRNGRSARRDPVRQPECCAGSLRAARAAAPRSRHPLPTRRRCRRRRR